MRTVPNLMKDLQRFKIGADLFFLEGRRMGVVGHDRRKNKLLRDVAENLGYSIIETWEYNFVKRENFSYDFIIY